MLLAIKMHKSKVKQKDKELDCKHLVWLITFLKKLHKYDIYR